MTVERQNLSMRTDMCRYAGLTNAFSKKIGSHCAALAIYFVQYNFTRIHKSMRMTPAGVTQTVTGWEDILGQMDTLEQAKKRGSE